MRYLNKTVGSLLLVLIGVTTSAYGAQALFTHMFPAVPTSVPVLTPSCGTSAILPAPSAVAPGSSGGVYFGCGSNNTVTGEAFSVAADGKAIPTFTLPVPYTGVALTQLATAPNPTGPVSCATSGPLALTSGTAFSFTGANGKGNKYYYCVSYTDAPSGTGLPSFPIDWKQ